MIADQEWEIKQQERYELRDGEAKKHQARVEKLEKRIEVRDRKYAEESMTMQ